MRHFAIGDLQGCLDPLLQLLDQLGYRRGDDRLILLGDLVNRGPDSLGVLRWARAQGDSVICLLGNHDLHLLAAARGDGAGRKDSFHDVLAAPDRRELLDWLRHRPLAWHHPDSDTLTVHAGLFPAWRIEDALAHAAEVESVLRGPEAGRLLGALYGNTPAHWSDDLAGIDRWRCIINALTRMRLLAPDGSMDFRSKGPASAAPAPLHPWFLHPGRRSEGRRVVFGHWSTLGRVHWPEAPVWGLDTGCVWGGQLTALELETGRLIQQPCPAQCAPGAD